MKSILLLLALLALLAAPLAAQTPTGSESASLPPEVQTGLRCAALFSIVAGEQARQAPEASDWPPLALRGKEFFVQVSARAMDLGGLDRAGLQALLQTDIAALRRPAARAALKAPCLAVLDANIPAAAVAPK